MKLYLIGLPGSGKSFLGKKLSEELMIPFIDLDSVIEQEAGHSISKIFSEKGEAYFRTVEAVALRQQSQASDFIMACGGGTPCFCDNMEFIKATGKSIFLNIPVSAILNRFNATEQQERPLLAETAPEQFEEKLNTLLKNRISFYKQADITLTDTRSHSEILARIKR